MATGLTIFAKGITVFPVIVTTIALAVNATIAGVVLFLLTSGLNFLTNLITNNQFSNHQENFNEYWKINNNDLAKKFLAPYSYLSLKAFYSALINPFANGNIGRGLLLIPAAIIIAPLAAVFDLIKYSVIAGLTIVGTLTIAACCMPGLVIAGPFFVPAYIKDLFTYCLGNSEVSVENEVVPTEEEYYVSTDTSKEEPRITHMFENASAPVDPIYSSQTTYNTTRIR